MPSGVSPVTAYTFAIVAGSLVLMGLEAVVFLPRVRPVKFCAELVRTDWKYLGVAWLVSAVVTKLAYRFHTHRVFTGVIYGFEGSIVAGLQSVANPALTAIFVAAYLAGLPTVVVFTYFKLKAHDEREARRYTLGYVVLVAVSLPFFVLVPVGVPALYAPAGVEPLMAHLSPALWKGMEGTDTMVKAFPSLHAGLAILAALYARKASPRYAGVTTLLSALVILSTFYLGVHWISDAGFALVLAGGAYWLSRRINPDSVLPIPGLDRFGSWSANEPQNTDRPIDD